MELGFDPLIILRLKTIQKVGIALGLLAAITASYWHFFLQERLRDMDQRQSNIREQEQRIATKRRLLRRLPQMREALAKLKTEEARAARKLPSKKEIPKLLTDISNAGHEQGLDFFLFAPGPEIKRELYAEVPVGIEVQGSFHATVLFMDQVTKLSRIVTFGDTTIEPTPKQTGLLRTKTRATTYRFLEHQALKPKGKKEKH